MTSSMAVVPEDTPRAYVAPECAANHRSNSATSGPAMNAERSSTDAIAASMRGFSCSYCSRRATSLIVIAPDVVGVIQNYIRRAGPLGPAAAGRALKAVPLFG